LFAVVLICFHIAERALSDWLHNKPLGDSLTEFGNGRLSGILAVGAIVFVMLVPFFMFTKIGRVLGPDKLWRLLLTRDRKRAFRRRVGVSEVVAWRIGREQVREVSALFGK
jgi:hypothetical protein